MSSQKKTTAPATPAAAQTAQAAKASKKTINDHWSTPAGSPAEEPTAQTTLAAAKAAAATKPKKSSKPIPVHPDAPLDPPGVVDTLLRRHLGLDTDLTEYRTKGIDELCTQLRSKADALAELTGSIGTAVALLGLPSQT